MAKMIDHVWTTSLEYIARMPKFISENCERFSANKEVAVFIAGLIPVPHDRNFIRIFDPDARIGMISIALLERIESIEELDTIELICYEKDSCFVDLLCSNLEWVCKRLTKRVAYKIVTKNYVIVQRTNYNCISGVEPITDEFDVVIQLQQPTSLSTNNHEGGNWLFDILGCINRIPSQVFSLNDMYAFENDLSKKYPQNHNIRPKIRQQLQVLRDKGFLEILGHGLYRKKG